MTLLLSIAAGWTMVAGAMFFGQRALLYHPDPRAPEPGPLAASGLAPLPVKTADGLELDCWAKPPAAPGGLTVALFHGNAGHHGHRLFAVMPLIAAGYGVALASYRGYGGNPGKPSEDGLYEDGRATLDALARAGIEADRIVLWGESLGTGVATKLASEQEVAGVVLQSPYTSIANRAQELYPFLPAQFLVIDRFENEARIGRLAAPLLIVHGEEDGVVPIAHGRRLFAAAHQPKRAAFIAAADHNDLVEHGLMDHILEFLAGIEAAGPR
ncbi:MAG: alpha/beta hydrolase [Proteobacteria bacterium]|nr:alpha/beta hydrolase [Pseudomonadota bacterium]MBI3496147.1 alpha/beta hydrolase [Pseudomonadota bacterium]